MALLIKIDGSLENLDYKYSLNKEKISLFLGTDEFHLKDFSEFVMIANNKPEINTVVSLLSHKVINGDVIIASGNELSKTYIQLITDINTKFSKNEINKFVRIRIKEMAETFSQVFGLNMYDSINKSEKELYFFDFSKLEYDDESIKNMVIFTDEMFKSLKDRNYSDFEEIGFFDEDNIIIKFQIGGVDESLQALYDYFLELEMFEMVEKIYKLQQKKKVNVSRGEE